MKEGYWKRSRRLAQQLINFNKYMKIRKCDKYGHKMKEPRKLGGEGSHLQVYECKRCGINKVR